MTETSIADLLDAAAHGDRLALAKALNAVDRRESAIPPAPRRPPSFGITGAPGAGKSTLIGALLTALRKRNRSVGVLLVDPSHPVTGGALLGDRIRMQEHSRDDRIFIRSLGSRKGTGGVSSDLEAALAVMAHFAFDLLLVETVGVGQLDTGIVPLVDKVLMLSNPDSGDDIQALKASNLDIAHAIVINKCDMPAREVRRHEKALQMRTQFSGATTVVPIYRTSAVSGEGIDTLVDEFFLATAASDSNTH